MSADTTQAVRGVLADADMSVGEKAAALAAMSWPAGGMNPQDRTAILATAQILATLAGTAR